MLLLATCFGLSWSSNGQRALLSELGIRLCSANFSVARTSLCSASLGTCRPSAAKLGEAAAVPLDEKPVARRLPTLQTLAGPQGPAARPLPSTHGQHPGAGWFLCPVLLPD